MSFRLTTSAGLWVLVLFAAGLLIVPGCDGTGGAALLRAGVFPNIPLPSELEGGGATGGGGGAVEGEPDEEQDEEGGGTPEEELPLAGTMIVTFRNEASIDAEIALWASDDLFASTALVQQNANLQPLGPEEAPNFLPLLRPGEGIQATLECIDARSISAAAAERLVLFNPTTCISPPIRQGLDFECSEDEELELLILIRDGRVDLLQIIVESKIYPSCVR